MPAVRWLIILFCLTAVLAGGCARVSRPEKNLAERLEYDAVVRERYRLDSEWWKVYNDRQLDQVVDIALTNNIDLAKSALSVNRALFQAKLLAADLVPGFSGGLDASARKNIKEGSPSTRSVGGNITLSYELDLWRKVADSVDAQEWEYRASIEDLAGVRLALINSVVDVYYNLAYLNDALEVAEKNLKNYRAIESTIQAKYEAGKVSGLESAQAHQSVLNAENSLIELQSQHKSAGQTLRDLLNLKPGEELKLKPSLAKLEPPALDLNIPLSVLANRPDLRAAEYRVEKAFKNVEVAEKGWLPTISLSSALSSSGVGFDQAFSNPTASAGLSIKLPFLDWSNVLYSLRISETDFESVRLDFEKALTTALNEVDTYYYTYRQSLKSMVKIRQKYAYDLRISKYYQDRYQSGAGELSDWLNALNTVNSSRQTALNSLYQTVQEGNMVYKALAGRYVDQAKELTPDAGSRAR